MTGRQPLVLDGLRAWKSLKELEVSEPAAFDDALDALREHSRISVLGLTAFPWARRPTRPAAVPTIRELSVQAPDHGGDLGVLRPLFPGSPISGWTPPPGAYWTSPRCTPGRACGCRSTG
ncbi:hypothetical protein [Streptomyces bacillaris]|uniref:hypothetical protein n=1 Tax=Streptomyces bacillaris TaxID=68179 RepID=UPI003D72AEAB